MNTLVAKDTRLLMLVVAVLVAAVSTTYSSSNQSESDAGCDPQQLSTTFRSAVDRVRPAIVTIETIGGPRNTLEWSKLDASQSDHPDDWPESGRPNQPLNQRRDSAGSGIIFDSRGFVLTCNHVVESAESVFVHLEDGRLFESSAILSDPMTDLAVIQLAKATELPTVQLGNSDDLRVGDWVVSIGNPYGLGVSVSAGIISATERHMPGASRTRLIQTDAATNPGNSGGALIDLHGRVIGISEGGYGVHGGFEGIGFAIPINAAKRIAERLIEHGRISRVHLGCNMETMDAGVARHLGIEPGKGLMVTDVTPQSPAARAGIQIGDVITHFAESPVGELYQLMELIEQRPLGESTSLAIVRNGRSRHLDVHLDEILAEENSGSALDESTPPRDGYYDERHGLVVDTLSDEATKQLGYADQTDGVLVTYVVPRSSASKQGICAGMLVLRVDNQKIRDIADYQPAVNARSADQGTLFLLAMPDCKHFVLVERNTAEK